jgi:F-type H+-transporting ATPase subunit b
MSIDAFTFVAQIVNFVTLVWLLKRFLFAPILAAINARETRITELTAKAEADIRDAELSKHNILERESELDAEIRAKRETALAETSSLLQKAKFEAQKELASLRVEAAQERAAEEQQYRDELLRLIQDEVFAITQNTLNDLANANIHSAIHEKFLAKILSLSEPEIKNITTTSPFSKQPAVVQSAVPLTETEKARCREALNKTLMCGDKTEFHVVPEIVAGVRVDFNGYRLGWSVSDHMASLASQLNSFQQNKICDVKENFEFEQREKKP